MRKPSFLTFLVGILILIPGMLFFFLPSLGGDVFLSPDETAVAVTAQRFGQTGSFRIDDQLLVEFPWLHPRSFVTQGSSLVPVGFLGVPAIAGALWALGGDWLMVFFPALLALSVCWPLWEMTKRLGRFSQIAGVCVWLTFPTVILYANRGLFPNLLVVSLAVWAAYLAWIGGRRPLVVAGALTGLALAIRPTEAIWVLPWVAFAFWLRTKKKSESLRQTAFCIPFALVITIFAFLGWKTNGALFTAGYQLRDPVVAVGTTLTVASSDQGISLPFGFHPRNVWFNVKSYLIVYLWPWTILAVAGLCLFWKEKKIRPWIFLSAWTLFSLLMLYGHGIYQDHVRVGEVSLANSFLRYTVPIAIIAVFLAAELTRKYVQEWSDRTNAIQVGRLVLTSALLVAIAAFGIWTALARDDEGLLQNAIELQRYTAIRERTGMVLPSGAVVFSERSDKIFFPTFRAVSPMPSDEQIRALLDARVPAGAFLRTMDENRLHEWLDRGIFLNPVFESGNETFYLMQRHYAENS